MLSKSTQGDEQGKQNTLRLDEEGKNELSERKPNSDRSTTKKGQTKETRRGKNNNKLIHLPYDG